ncbi:hypothetical protein IWZ03DRAFT_383694 [Phyllosticta citriasiana]|uniref:Secreted protein n=1 Tax=Phyllosticta citriasiana TaxID=595635 RepID=A0ABR1KG89_9PEZI
MSTSLFSCLSVLQAACTAQHGRITLYMKLSPSLCHLFPSPIHPLLPPSPFPRPNNPSSSHPFFAHLPRACARCFFSCVLHPTIPQQHTIPACPAFPVVSLSWSYTPI